MGLLENATIEQMLLYIGVICVVGVTGTVLAFKFFTRSAKAGFMPKRVAKKINRFVRINKFKVFENITLQHDDTLFHIDFLAVGSFGAILVQTKDIFGEIYGTPSEERWISVNASERIPFMNPLTEIRSAQRHLQGIFTEHGIHNIYLDNLTVFPATSSLNVSLEKSIVTEKQLIPALDKMQYMEDSQYSIEKFIQAVEDTIVA